jgi:hypothetical protein
MLFRTSQLSKNLTSILVGECGKIALLICLTSIALPAQSQYQYANQNSGQSSGQSLENMLDAVESTANWSNNKGAQYQSNPYTAQSGQFQQRPIYNKPFLNQGVPCHVPMRSVPSLSVQNLNSLGQQNQMPTGHISPGQMTFRLLRAANSAPSSPRSTGGGRSLRFGGSSGGSGGSASDNFYRAQDQADRAREAYDRSWHGDKYNREQAAEEAQYAAREARREADEAFSKADSGDPNARTYAQKALAAAEDAQSYADKAETNAERAEDNSRRGW